MAGKATSIAPRQEPDTRFQQTIESISSTVGQNITPNTITNRLTSGQFLKTRNSIVTGLNGNLRDSITIASGVLDITDDSSGNSIIPRPLIIVDPEASASTDILDLLEMDGNELEGTRITLMGILTKEVIITHLATASGTKKNFTCPGNVDYILDGEDSVDIIYDKTSETWVVLNSTTYGTLEIRTKESTTGSFIMFRDDATPNDGNKIGEYTFRGNDSAGNQTTYARISGYMEDVTNGTEDGALRFGVMEGASVVNALIIDGNVKEFQVLDAHDFAIATTTGTKIGTGSTQKIGFWGVTPVVQRSAYTVTNHITDRSYDANSTTVAELADVLGTLLVDLRSIGIVQ